MFKVCSFTDWVKTKPAESKLYLVNYFSTICLYQLQNYRKLNHSHTFYVIFEYPLDWNLAVDQFPLLDPENKPKH